MNVLHFHGILEQWCNFFGDEACNATSYLRYQESQFRMFLGEGDELIDVRTDFFRSPMHRRNTISLTLKPDTLSPNGSPFYICQISGSATMRPCKLLPKTKISPGRNSVIRLDVVLLSINSCSS